jgi:7-cyano-7-deazaguanine synthase in queuosine biosynthesis
MKVPLIVWSGGLDSTYLVWDAVSRDKTIETMYVDLNNNKTKKKREIKARKAIKKKLLKDYNGNIRKDHIVKVPTLHPNKNIHLIQPLVWFLGVNLTFDPEKHTHVEFGYIRGDDFWHVRHHMDKCYQEMDNIIHNQTGIKIKYPLEWRDKTNILQTYQEHEFGKDILPFVTSCESGEEEIPEDCCCTPCVHRKMAEFEINYKKYDISLDKD